MKVVPDILSVWINLGVVLRGKGDVKGAIAAFREAIKLAPKYVNAHINLGDIYQLQKQYMEAIACVRDAIKADPKSAEAHALLGMSLRDSGDIPNSAGRTG